MPQYPPYTKSKELTVKDLATDYIVTSSLQTHVQRQVNTLILNNNFSQIKGINGLFFFYKQILKFYL